MIFDRNLTEFPTMVHRDIYMRALRLGAAGGLFGGNGKNGTCNRRQADASFIISSMNCTAICIAIPNLTV